MAGHLRRQILTNRRPELASSTGALSRSSLLRSGTGDEGRRARRRRPRLPRSCCPLWTVLTHGARGGLGPSLRGVGADGPLRRRLTPPLSTGCHSGKKMGMRVKQSFLGPLLSFPGQIEYRVIFTWDRSMRFGDCQRARPGHSSSLATEHYRIQEQGDSWLNRDRPGGRSRAEQGNSQISKVGSVKQVVQVALKIKEAADTVQHNKEVCHQIRGRVNRLRAILSKLVDTDVLNDPATSGTLKDLEETLHRAYALIAACRVERNVVSLLFTAGKLSRKLRQVNDDILAQMAVASFGSNVQTSIMLTKHFQDTPKEPEQVELALLFQEDAEHVISSSCSHSQHSITLQGSDEIDGALEVQEPSRISKMLHTSLPWFTVFTYSQLRHATNKFSCTPGMGCSVYKGILHDGSQVVVKRISYYPPSCKEKCENELRTTAVLQHVNILKLIGCCRTKSELFHVYEFMKNGTLANHICGYTGSSLPWPLRFKIVEGVAQGLLYLHKQCGLSIIHLDIKPANIMLDDRYIPKIGDFGNFLMLPQFADEGETPCLRGTVGFIAPDLMTTGRFSAKSDVYSYGVLLLETVSGKSCLQADRNFNTLSAWVWHLWKSRKLIEVIDRQLLRGVADVSQTKEMKRCIHIALLCIELDPAHRPTASDVVRMLSDKRLKLPIPQQPAGTNENEDGSDSEQID